MHGKIVKLILIGLKISFALSLIYYLFNEGAIDFTPVLDLLHRRTKVLALTALLLLMGLVLSGLRWWFLMRAAGFRLRLGLVLRLQLIGAFFSTWLPGAAGGDAARGAYIMRLLAARRTTALLTVAMDRLFSLFGLIFVAAVLVLLNFKEAGAQPILEFYVLLILVTMAAGALGVVLVYIAAVRLRVHTLPQWIEKLRPYAHQLRGAVILVGSRWGTMLVCAFVSALASASVVAGIVVLSTGFRFAPELIVTALASALGNISSAIPLTPGGIGIGEMTFAKVCEELGAATGPFATIYLSFRIIMAAVSFSGLFAWLSFSSGRHAVTDRAPAGRVLTIG